MEHIFIVEDTFGLSTVHYGDTVIAYIAFRLGYLIAFKLVDKIRILDKRACEGYQLKIFLEYFADLFP